QRRSFHRECGKTRRTGQHEGIVGTAHGRRYYLCAKRPKMPVVEKRRVLPEKPAWIFLPGLRSKKYRSVFGARRRENAETWHPSYFCASCFIPCGYDESFRRCLGEPRCNPRFFKPTPTDFSCLRAATALK